VIDRYGILNTGNARVDRKGIVRWKSVEIDYKTRPSNEQILEALRTVR
jgi:hypothetical protein